mgnify:CR=1 FL=1
MTGPQALGRADPAGRGKAAFCDMDVLLYNDLNPGKAQRQFERVVELLRRGDFRAADVKKLVPTPYYRAKLNDADRLLFRFGDHQGRRCLLVLEVLFNHAYEKSRFLNGARIDESRLQLLPEAAQTPAADDLALSYVNPAARHFHLLDKILSFDDAQEAAFHLQPPFILIGSAGSGKTVLTLEKIKQFEGDILYVTRSPHLAENSRNLYYAHNYDNDRQNVDFLSFREFLETLRVPEGQPMTFRAFEAWFSRCARSARLRDAHKLYEEINGVLTGAAEERPFLTRDEYLGLGIRRSIFTPEERPAAYDAFERYRQYLAENGYYDLNLVAHASLPLCRPAYDLAVVDEVQDLTMVQLRLILKSLRVWDQFVLCGDSNQIVHPNFFSWAGVKAMFYERQVRGAPREIIRVLNTNYRNSPPVTEIANRLLLVKNARFGSIDRESHYLVRAIGTNTGSVELVADSEAARREFNEKTRRSVRHAVIVLRAEDKAEARRHFQTPLLFCVQEAKGLEYENILLLNFVSGCPAEFDEVARGVAPQDLDRDLKYARAKDKTDKTLEAYKFYINALYVALTRAMRRVYLIERQPQHRLLALLGLKPEQKALHVTAQQSSAEEWREEARKLEQQGKTEQAEEIRRSLLPTQPVPWRVWTPETLPELEREAFDPARFNQQAKHLIFEYAVTYHVPHIFQRLVQLGYGRARNPSGEQRAVEQKYARDFEEKSLHELQRKLALYGMDFRNALNQTPLMVAARLGHVAAVRLLLKGGAHRELRDNWGRTAFWIALREAYRREGYAQQRIGDIYGELAPSAIKVKVAGRMIKIDARHMAFFLLNSMLAVFQDLLRIKIERSVPAFESGDFVRALKHFPERVIPEYRRQRPYLSSILAGNEVARQAPRNMQLFVRVRHGFYLPNPWLELEVDERWVNVYDLLPLADLRREQQNARLQYFLNYLDQLKTRMAQTAAAAAPAAGPASAPPPKAETQPTAFPALQTPFQPDWPELVDTILRRRTPRRAHHIELFQDAEIRNAIAERFELARGLRRDDPDYGRKLYVAVQRFCGMDYVRVGLVGLEWPLFRQATEDTAGLRRQGGRHYQDEHRGPIMSWQDFEQYPWPDPAAPAATRELEWYQRHLPDDMCIIASGGFAHFCELLTWLMGYETFCLALYEQRDLVAAIAARLTAFYRVVLRRMLEFDRVKIVWASDDMGFKTGLLFAPDDMRRYVLAGHREMAALAHAAGRPYLLHSCGKLTAIMEDLIEDVRIDGKHSFEDTIEDVRQLKHGIGRRIALLGGIDVDFLCRATPEAVRQRVRETLAICQPGGGYCLGTGNSVANYIPLDNYLAMLDEGRRY